MKISSIRELGKIADKIKKVLSSGDVVFLYGEIGVGKTTFARLLINGFESEKKLKKRLFCTIMSILLFSALYGTTIAARGA